MRIPSIQLETIKGKVASLSKHQLTPIVSLGFIAGLFGALLMTNNQAAHDNSKANPDDMIISRLNELQSHLVSLESATGKPVPEIDLSRLEQKLKELSQEIAESRQFNPDDLKNRIENRLDEAQQNISHQLNTLNSTISSIKADNGKAKYLSPKALPFSVVSIDSIQNIPVASIQYDYKTIPLEKGDLLAGWKVVQVDFRHQQIEFENKNKDHVLLKQDNIG